MVSPASEGTRAPLIILIRSVFGVLFTGLVIGVVGSFLAVAFVEAIGWLWHTLQARPLPVSGGLNLTLLIAPIVGGLVVGQLVRRTGERRPFSITDLVFLLQTRQDRLSAKDGVLTTVAAVIGMGSGASTGIYGPLTTLGASLGSNIGRWLQWDRTLAIGCGVAAAISTAFSAPIAALVFVHEVILRHYSLRAFAPVAVASSTGFFIANYLLQRPPLFRVSAERSFFAPEFFAFVVIGLLGAAVAIVFMRGILFASRLAADSGIPMWLRPAVAGIGIGLIAQWLPEALGVGTWLLDAVVQPGGFDASELALLLVAKIVASALCLGFGFVGGGFSPSLVIGVLAGALMGIVGEQLFGEMSSGLAVYAVCGMMAVTSPVIGAPLTAILVVFELTRNYELTTAVMISVVFSNVVSYRLFGRSLFDMQLLKRGIDLSHGRDNVILQRTSIANHVTTDAVTVSGTSTLVEARDAMQAANRQECVVLDDLSRYLGKLRLGRVMQQIGAGDAVEAVADHADTHALTLLHDQSVWHALHKLRDHVGELVPIVDQRGYYIGVIVESALVAAYLDTLDSLRAEEHAAS